MQSRNASSGSLPGWVLPVAIIVGVLVVGLVGWKAFTGGSASAPGKAVAVRPGMVDFRQEMQKGHPASPLGGALH